MRNFTWMTAVDALTKIEALAAASQFLTESDAERALGIELMAVVEEIARKAQETASD